ncbi:GntR family transcriptional regulator [Roseibium sp. Sym1]|uniref:GntR family transcriptional regulator n=1 Tax=Roseibium sp. Sym1 TaxID=3016006 RepID=UPI0022B51349|nr:GntR family transcriptional regulator [Roseibium sp. Sym1]
MQVTPEPVSKLSTTEPIGAQLVSILRGRIIRNELQPGTRLSEAGIASEFDISRQPVREVFIRLAEEGLLEVRPQRGTIVPRISARMVEDARFIREAIEADVVKHAAAKFDRGQVAELDQLLEHQKRAKDVHEFIELDDQFHRGLADGIGRAHAWNVIEALKAQLDRVRYLSLQQFPKAKLIEQHSAVIEAIRAGDPGQAEAAMRRHLNTIVDDLPVIAAEQPDHFE